MLQWDGDHYASHTAHHRAYDDVLLSRLTHVADDADIVDVGCGVGDFTRGLVDLVPNGTVRGLDADPSMIATALDRAAAAGASTSFEVCRAEQIARVLPRDSVDLMVSTACLHWLPRPQHPEFLNAAHDVLRPGGRLLVEFGGAGQLQDIRGVLDPLARAAGGQPPSWWFATVAEYTDLLEQAGFDVWECVLVRQRRAIPDAEALRGWLTSQVLVGYQASIPVQNWTTFQAGCAAGVEALVRQPDGSCDVEYVRLVIDATSTRGRASTAA